MDDLTKDAKKLLCEIYKAYLEKCKTDISKKDANMFSSCDSIHKEIVPKWKLADVEEACRELNNEDFINCSWYDNTGFNISLTTKAISTLENRFKNDLKAILKFLSSLV